MRYPSDLVDRILDGGSPLRVIREWRSLNQDERAAAAKISKNLLSQIENGRDLTELYNLEEMEST